MKKLVLVLVAMFGLYLGANAQVLSCDIYNADGLTAKLCQKGAQSTNNGTFSIPVEVIAKPGSKYAGTLSTMVTVSVEVIDQNSRDVVKREDIIVMVKDGRGFTSKSVNKHDGYEPNHDYLFSINRDRTCNQ